MGFKTLIILSLFITPRCSVQVDKIECVEGSLDRESLFYLLRVAEKSEKCLHEAQNVYARQYSNRKVYQKETFEDQIISDENSIQIYDDFIALRKFNTTKKFFRIFGGFVFNIHISFYGSTVAEGREIAKHINDYCSDSLKTMKIMECKGDVLDDFKTPFKNVELVWFSSNSLIVNENAIKFNKLFPSLKTLLVDQTNTTVWTLIGTNFPNLKELAIELPPANDNGEFNEEPALNILMGKHKIRDLTIKRPTLKLLNEVHLLPLRSLSIMHLPPNYSNYADDINFDQLRYVTFIGMKDIPHKIHFSNISELELIIYANFTDEWMEFLDTQINNKISILELDVEYIKNEHFSRIASIFNHLTDAVIRCPKFFQSNDLLDFMDKLENLENFKIYNKMKMNHHDEFKNHINGKWDILIEKRYQDESSFDLVRADSEEQHNQHVVQANLVEDENEDEEDQDNAANIIHSYSMIASVLFVTLNYITTKIF